jgi:hypothetical protein
MQLMRVAGRGSTAILGLARLSVRRARQQTTLRPQLCLSGKLSLNRKRLPKDLSQNMNSSRLARVSARADQSESWKKHRK